MKIDYPYIGDIRLALVQIYSQSEQYEKAIQELEEWLIVSPNEEQAIELLQYLRSQTENIDICRCLIEPGNTQWYKDTRITCRDAISEKIGVPNWETINFSQNPMLDAKWESLKSSCGY